MTRSPQPDYTPELRALLAEANISSFRALSQQAGTSLWPVQQLRRGRADRLSVHNLIRLANALRYSPLDLVRQFSSLTLDFHDAGAEANSGVEANSDLLPDLEAAGSDGQADRGTASDSDAEAGLRQEYQHLQTQLATLSQDLRQTFQQECLDILEPLMIQLPVALHSATQNPELPATRLIPILRPLERLLAAWEIVEIGPVGAIVPFDPQWHQPISTAPTTGDQVKIRYPGYRQGEVLLHRARVSLPDPT